MSEYLGNAYEHENPADPCTDSRIGTCANACILDASACAGAVGACGVNFAACALQTSA